MNYFSFVSKMFNCLLVENNWEDVEQIESICFPEKSFSNFFNSSWHNSSRVLKIKNESTLENEKCFFFKKKRLKPFGKKILRRDIFWNFS